LIAPTGKFILSFETLEGSRIFEAAVFDFVTNTWDFAGLTFEENQPAKIETQICKGCHTANPHKLGDDSQRMWIGFNPIDFPAGIILLDALLEDDPLLAVALPELATTLKDTRLKALFNLPLDEHPGWSSYDFGFQGDFYNATQSSETLMRCATGSLEPMRQPKKPSHIKQKT
jgi:hypothetical protein